MQKILLPGELIKEIRRRKGLRQIHIQERHAEACNSMVTLSRIENLRQNPTTLTLTALLSKVELPYRQFFCPYMEDQPAESFTLRRQILYLLDRAEGDAEVIALARKRIKLLKGTLNPGSLINKQLWLSLQTELDTLAGRGDDETLHRIRSAIKITYPEFEESHFDGEVLILYECELMISLARCYANRGDVDTALAILARIREGYQKQPLNDMYKEILLNEIQNLTVRYLLQKGDHWEALAASAEGMILSKKLSGSTRQPMAVYLRAMAIFHTTGDVTQAVSLLKQAYFAFALLKRGAMQEKIFRIVQELTGEGFETYHTEPVGLCLPADFFQFKGENALAAHNIGELLRQFRIAAGAKQSEVYKGICSRAFYSRIESGERTNVSFFILEALMQRLGRNIDRYIEYFTSIQEWEENRLRMQYLREEHIGNREEAQGTLDQLLKVGDFTQGLGKQFMLYAQALMRSARGEVKEALKLLLEAIKITHPDYTEEGIGHMRLTYYECNIIGEIAALTIEHIEAERGMAMLLALQDSMNRFYVDDCIKARFYTDLLASLAKHHYKMGKYQEALVFAQECESICQRHDVLFLLNANALIMTKCLYQLGRKEEAIAYGAMAYYSGALTAPESDMKAIEAFAAESLGISFPQELGFVFHQEKIGTYAAL